MKEVGPRRKIRIAVAGCSHGEMDRIYETMAELEREERQTFDLLICCGDYQAVRNYGDLHHVNVPDKYRQLMTFYKYYSGEKVGIAKIYFKPIPRILLHKIFHKW